MFDDNFHQLIKKEHEYIKKKKNSYLYIYIYIIMKWFYK